MCVEIHTKAKLGHLIEKSCICFEIQTMITKHHYFHEQIYFCNDMKSHNHDL